MEGRRGKTTRTREKDDSRRLARFLQKKRRKVERKMKVSSPFRYLVGNEERRQREAGKGVELRGGKDDLLAASKVNERVSASSPALRVTISSSLAHLRILQREATWTEKKERGGEWVLVESKEEGIWKGWIELTLIPRGMFLSHL